MKLNDKTTFKSGGFYHYTSQVQENTVLNRGLLDLGGYAVPQIIMSNNKDEKIERGLLSGLYFASSFLAPFVLLPMFNKIFLKKYSLVRDFTNNEKMIIEVSKKYLTKDADLATGIRETALKLEKDALKNGKIINVKNDFERILHNFDKDALRGKLLKIHEKVLFADFLATSLLWCATPWIATEITRLRTNRSGFSATYNMIDEKQSAVTPEKYKKDKKKKLLYSALIGIIPALIAPKILTKAFENKAGFLSNIVKKIPQNFNYNKGMFPSKTIFALIWLLSDYPSSLVSARDKYERKDRAIRGLASILAFFGGDFVLNNILGRLSDKTLKTQIMEQHDDKLGTLRKLLLKPKSFAEIEDLKNITPKLLTRTKKVGAALYWITLFANMAFCGFAVPFMLNKMLKKSIAKDVENHKV